MICLIILKYILMLLLAFESIARGSHIEPTPKSYKQRIKDWWKSRPLRQRNFLKLFTVPFFTICISIVEDCASTTNQRELKVALSTQQKSLGTLVYNMETSNAGKDRFLNSVMDIAHISSVQVNGTGFEGLICKNGIAIYWYDSDTETITGFHFFTNAEVNRILSGMPLGTSFVDGKGDVNLSSDSEMAIAFRECLFDKLPKLSNNAIENERSKQNIFREIEMIVRYVYRGENIEFRAVHYSGNSTKAGLSTGDFDLSFKYVVNPMAEKKYYRGPKSGSLILTSQFINSLHGITKAAFSEKIISFLRERGIEPKVDISGIRKIEYRRYDSQLLNASPFEELRRR